MATGLTAIKGDKPASRILGHCFFFFFNFITEKGYRYHSLLKIIFRKARIV